MLTASFDALAKEEQKRVKKETAPFDEYIKFRGFDGNNDPQYSVMAFFNSWPGKYDELGEHPLNSHSSATLPHYRRMLEQYVPIMSARFVGNLTAEEIIKIIKS